jgi:hypothetical protein
MKKDLKQYNEMIDRNFLELWALKQNYKVSLASFENFPIKLFNIDIIFNSIIEKFELDENVAIQTSEKLIDIKTLFFFLNNCTTYFQLGATLIVGNGELEKVDINTISLIQRNHYKVYLISSLYEKILDFLDLLYYGKISDPKNDKWGTLYNKLSKKDDFTFIQPKDNKAMLLFREKVRRGEIHGFSSVFRQLYKNEWNHFQNEEDILKTIIKNIFTKFNTLPEGDI